MSLFYYAQACPLGYCLQVDSATGGKLGGLSGALKQRTLTYIDASIHTGLTADAIAGVAGLSKYHFGKAFKQCTGVTLHRYVLARRIGRSQELLVHSDLPLAAIAQATGFSSQSHFTAAFSKCLGISPGVYRNMRERQSITARF